MARDKTHAEERRLARYESAQRRRVITHAARYSWRDGTLEVETAALLVLAGLLGLAVDLIPAAGPLREMETLALAVALLGLAVLVEVVAAGFRYHISQGVGGLVGSPPRSRALLTVGGAVVALCVAVGASSFLAWRAAALPGVPLPVGALGSILGGIGAAIGTARGTRRMVACGAELAILGGLIGVFLRSSPFDAHATFSAGLFVMAIVPLVSGFIGFHQYRRDVDSRHDEYVRDAAALVARGRPAQRAVAAESLGRLGGLEAIAPLTDALADSDEDVRIAAAFALAEARELVPARLLVRRLDVRGFEPGEEVPAEEVKEVEQLALVEWQDLVGETYRSLVRSRPQLLDGLIASTASEQPGPVRRTAMLVLAETREPGAIAHLTNVLAEGPEESRSEARAALAWTGPAGAEALAELARHDDGSVRAEAIEALVQLVAVSGVTRETRLEQCMFDGILQDPEGSAGDVLEEWRDIAAVARGAFEAAAVDPEQRVRDAARAALELVA